MPCCYLTIATDCLYTLANDPLHAAEELYGIVPRDTRRPFDIREVIARLPRLAEAA